MPLHSRHPRQIRGKQQDSESDHSSLTGHVTQEKWVSSLELSNPEERMFIQHRMGLAGKACQHIRVVFDCLMKVFDSHLQLRLLCNTMALLITKCLFGMRFQAVWQHTLAPSCRPWGCLAPQTHTSHLPLARSHLVDSWRMILKASKTTLF